MKNLILLFSLLLFSLSGFAEIEPCDANHDGVISGSEQYLCTHKEIPIEPKKIKQKKSQETESTTNENKTAKTVTKSK